jgi:hypothetical protein
MRVSGEATSLPFFDAPGLRSASNSRLQFVSRATHCAQKSSVFGFAAKGLRPWRGKRSPAVAEQFPIELLTEAACEE